MAHTRKDTYTRTCEWWKHLRPFGKRIQAKRERRYCRKHLLKNEQ
jgi:hypothetical protein